MEVVIQSSGNSEATDLAIEEVGSQTGAHLQGYDMSPVPQFTQRSEDLGLRLDVTNIGEVLDFLY